MKKVILAVVAGALIMGVGAGVSYAYLTGSDKVINEFLPSEVTVCIKEKFDPPSEIVPGSVIPKAPKAASTSTTDCYVRMKVCFSDSEAEEACEPLQIQEGWQAAEDGYYYWQEAVKPGAETAALFETIRVKADAQQVPEFDVLVYAEAVCCAGKTAQEAWKEMDMAQV